MEAVGNDLRMKVSNSLMKRWLDKDLRDAMQPDFR